MRWPGSRDQADSRTLLLNLFVLNRFYRVETRQISRSRNSRFRIPTKHCSAFSFRVAVLCWRHVVDPTRMKILPAQGSITAASGFLSNEFRFGSLLAPQRSYCQAPSGAKHEKRTRLSQPRFRSPPARHCTSPDGAELVGGKCECYFRRRSTPSRGRNGRRLRPDVFPHRGIKSPRVYLNQYCPREDISRQESSDYRSVAVAARTHRRNG
jgi:hypothetical protein